MKRKHDWLTRTRNSKDTKMFATYQIAFISLLGTRRYVMAFDTLRYYLPSFCRPHSPWATLNWRPNAPPSREGRVPTRSSPRRWRALLQSALPSRTAVPGKAALPWGSTWRLWPRCAAIMRKAEKLPTRSSLPGCMKSPRAQRPNLVCAPSSRTSASSATTPTANRSFPNRGMRVTCETFSPLSFQLITREGSIKNDLSTIYLWAIVLPYSISQYYARSCLEQKQENLRGPCWTPLCRSTPEVLGLWLDGDYSEWSTDKSRTTNQSNENTFVSLWMRSCTRTLLTEKLRIHQSCI